MSMINALPYLLSAFLGVALSLFFVGGLWWTLQRIQQRRWPEYGLFLSYWLRLSVVGAVFVAVAWGGHWDRLLVSAAAFALTRPLWVCWWTREDNKYLHNEGRSHAD
jgi:F1F0 ATPase subunit 2